METRRDEARRYRGPASSAASSSVSNLGRKAVKFVTWSVWKENNIPPSQHLCTPHCPQE